MKKYLFPTLLAAGVLAIAVPAFAATQDGTNLNWGSQVNANACGTTGAPIINVNQKITNDADSGFAGYWALDNLNRTIKVWQVSDNSFCATVRYSGQFTSIPGAVSPSGDTSQILTGNERGTFEGGYTATFNGTLRTDSPWSSNGSVGSFDYACSPVGWAANCTGYVDWVGQYFTYDSNSFNQPWWGWIYHGGKYGTWVNSLNLNAGDIMPAVH